MLICATPPVHYLSAARGSIRTVSLNAMSLPVMERCPSLCEEGLSSAREGVCFEGMLKRWSKPGMDSAKDRIGIKLLRGAVLTLTAAGEGC